MSDRLTGAEELAAGHDEQRGFARLAYSELRARGILRFEDKAGREYWVSDQKLQIVLPDNSMVQYNVDRNSIAIKAAGEDDLFQGYEEFIGDFTPFVEAIGTAQAIALSDDPSKYGRVLNSVTTGQRDVAAEVQEVLS